MIHIRWGIEHETIADTIEGLELVLDEIALSARDNGMLVVVEVSAYPHSAINLDVGGEQSHLEYVNRKSVPVLAISKGIADPSSEDRVVVSVEGVSSSVAVDTMVDVGLALEAVREYCKTNALPTCIDWFTTEDNKPR